MQAETLPPSAFLRNFLQSHDGWRSLQPSLCDETLRQQLPGLGFHVPVSGLDMLGRGVSSIDVASVISCLEDRDISHGSEYATSLGFEGDIVWPTETKTGSSKKKKKKKKKKTGGGSNNVEISPS